MNSDFICLRLFSFLQEFSFDDQKNQPFLYLGQILLEQNTACSVSKKNKKPITRTDTCPKSEAQSYVWLWHIGRVCVASLL